MSCSVRSSSLKVKGKVVVSELNSMRAVNRYQLRMKYTALALTLNGILRSATV